MSEATRQLAASDYLTAQAWARASRPGGPVAGLLEGWSTGLASRDKGTGTRGEELSWSGLCWKAFSPLLP